MIVAFVVGLGVIIAGIFIYALRPDPVGNTPRRLYPVKWL